MDEQKKKQEEIFRRAKGIAKQFLFGKGLGEHRYLIDDATQEIALAGWQCSETTDQVGFIVKRMRSRLKTWWIRYLKEKSHRSSESPRKTLEEETIRDRRRRRRESYDPEALKSFLDTRLNPRQRQIAKYFMAGFTHKQITEELGISDRTVQRERDWMKERYRIHLNDY